jgi:hypothetical protein
MDRAFIPIGGPAAAESPAARALRETAARIARQLLLPGPAASGPTNPGRDKASVAFAGHGFLAPLPDADALTFRLPANVTLVFWCRHGETLDDQVAQYIEARRPLAGLPRHLQTRLDHGATAAAGGAGLPETYPGGSEMFEYRLTYPRGLTLGSSPAAAGMNYPGIGPPVDPGATAYRMRADAVPDAGYSIVAPFSDNLLQSSLRLSDLLRNNAARCAGATVHWCACRSVAWDIGKNG